MKISVLTVCRNAEATLPRTIASFLAQDYPSKQMILVDVALTDRTRDVAESFHSPEIRILSEPGRGMYDALDKALRLHEGDAVGVLNADDRYYDTKVLSRLANALHSHDAVHGDLDFQDMEGRVVRRWRCRTRPPKGFAAGWMPAHPTFYVRRHVANAVGAFDLSLPTASDYDWMLRAIDIRGTPLTHLPYVLVDMAIGGRSTASLTAYLRHNFEALSSPRRWLKAGFVDWALIAKPASMITQVARLRGAVR